MPVSFPPQNTAKQNRKISQTESSFLLQEGLADMLQPLLLQEALTDMLQPRIWDLPVCNIQFYSYGKMCSNELK
jgi:hypothetical protein